MRRTACRSPFPRRALALGAVLALCTLLATLAGAPAPGTPTAGAAGHGTVPVGHIEGVVAPGTARYVARLIATAERQRAPLVLLTLDTTAGYPDATRRVVEHIERSPLPVVVFVRGDGGRAHNAGLFILQAADVTAMSPSTSAGASGPRPPAAGGAPPAVAEAAGLAGRLAQARGRDARAVRRLVLDGAQLTATEALRQGVVDEVASDPADLLLKLDGRRVSGPWGQQTLSTRPLATEPVQPDWLERAMDVIVDPNVAYLLLVLGLYGVITELSAPGVTVPGVAGGIALLLALLAFSNLPVNWLGVGLIVVAAGLLLAEVQISSHGLLTLAGLVSFLAGSVLLFRPPGGVPSPYGASGALNPWLIAALGTTTAVACVWLVRQSLISRRQPPANTLPETGQVGVAGPVVDATGTVQLDGQTWSAEWAPDTVAPGQRVRVVGRRGLRLIVEPAEPAGRDST